MCDSVDANNDSADSGAQTSWMAQPLSFRPLQIRESRLERGSNGICGRAVVGGVADESDVFTNGNLGQGS